MTTPQRGLWLWQRNPEFPGPDMNIPGPVNSPLHSGKFVSPPDMGTKQDGLLLKRTNTPTRPPAFNHTVLSTPGEALSKSSKNYFESKFNYDFSHVRIHQDQQAAQSASSVSAKASKSQIGAETKVFHKTNSSLNWLKWFTIGKITPASSSNPFYDWAALIPQLFTRLDPAAFQK